MTSSNTKRVLDEFSDYAKRSLEHAGIGAAVRVDGSRAMLDVCGVRILIGVTWWPDPDDQSRHARLAVMCMSEQAEPFLTMNPEAALGHAVALAVREACRPVDGGYWSERLAAAMHTAAQVS